jgi:two-component system, NarL family, sensor histidine kinase FusK
MATRTLPELQPVGVSMAPGIHGGTLRSIFASAPVSDWAASNAVAPFVLVFLAYVAAGILGQATSNIRSSNLGPVWPAYGIALAAGLKYGYRIWPALAASAFLVAVQGSVSAAGAAGQAIGATLGALTGTFLLRRIANFDPSLSRLRDALGLIVLGAFGSALVSSVIGVFSLYATGIQPYSGLPSAWLIYWLGDSTGVLLVTPLLFTPLVWQIPSRARSFELLTLLTLLTAACFLIFGDWHVLPIRVGILAFAVLPFVIWGAIGFGVGGATLTVFLTAALATVLTAFGFGPFAGNTTFVNAVLLDVLFIELSVTGLALAAVIAERERAEQEHQRLIREQAAMEARHALAAANRKLIEAQEQERSRIARELHDNVSQRLALLMFELSAPPESQSTAVDLHARVSEIAADVHALSHNLHWSKLDVLGFATAMEMLCKEVGEQYQVRVALHAHDVPTQLPPDTALCLYRILQEALQNAAKHSGVGDVDVRLWGTSEDMNLEVSDRGAGFDLETASKRSPGIGLVSMRERIQLVCGELSIQSARQRGTRIHARVPLNRPTEAEPRRTGRRSGDHVAAEMNG